MRGGWGATALVALISAVPPLVAASIFGVVETPDSPTYLGYAAQLVPGPRPEGAALLAESAMPLTLYRTIGYPAVLVALQWLSPTAWPALLLALQVVAQSVVAAAAHRVALALGFAPLLAFAAALMPAAGMGAVVQSAVMTDALFGLLFTGAMLLLLRAGLAGGRLGPVALAGVMLGLATAVREATPYLLLGLLPAAAIAAGPGRRLAGMGLLAVPVAIVAGLMVADNHRRSGAAVLSTTRAIVMVQAVLPLTARGLPVYDGDDLFDRAARATVVPRGFEGIGALHARLHAAGMTSPEIAAVASERYARAWRRFPLEMLRAMAVRFPLKTLFVTFQPVDMAADFARVAGEPRPWFSRNDQLLRRAGQGSWVALLLLPLMVVSRVVALAVSIAAIAAPLILRRDDPRWWPLFGAWLGSAALVGIYLPVHLEQRYLVPVVPVLCLLGVAALAALRARRAART